MEPNDALRFLQEMLEARQLPGSLREDFERTHMQPTIHPSSISSAKIETDPKGNPKPTVHVYDPSAERACDLAYELYTDLCQRLRARGEE